MDARRRLANSVLESGCSVSSAARDAGVSRQTAHLWVKRAKEVGLSELREHSRRPQRSPGLTSETLVQLVLEAAAQYPAWGPRTLRAVLWPHGDAPVCERTVARILDRAGRRVAKHGAPAQEPMRFERETENELWQVDFKRVGHLRSRKDCLSVLDDARRYCVLLRQVPDQGLESAWGALWDAFGEYGLPGQILCDNGSAFRNNATWRWSRFDLRLMLLGIRPSHGRPYHPQTQGKVERFHGTIEREISFERDACIQELLDTFRDRYNWVRPHQALDLRTPGSLYKPSARKRPASMPEPFFPEGAVIRRCHDNGVMSYKGERYKLGKAFIGLPVGILISETEPPKVVWGDFILAPLQDLKL